jgi:hypothetical protein
MCADVRNVGYPSEIRLGNRNLTVKMVLGGHRDLTGFVTGAPLVASLGANTSALHESKYSVSTTGFAQYLYILGDFTVTINTTAF